jgi:hypothetical protein
MAPEMLFNLMERALENGPDKASLITLVGCIELLKPWGFDLSDKITPDMVNFVFPEKNEARQRMFRLLLNTDGEETEGATVCRAGASKLFEML